MALIKIHADGTFDTAYVEEATASGVTQESLKAAMKVLAMDKFNANKIDTLRARREQIQHDHKAKGKVGPRTAVAYKARIDKINGVIKSLTSQMSGGKYIKPDLLSARIQKAMARLTKLRGPGHKPTPAHLTPRAPKDPAASFNAGAKKIAGTVSRGIRSELRDHGKTALVPVANRAGSKAPVAKPSGKTANTATTHATKPARGAIGNTLTEIKKIKASIATGELKGAKLVRAREELAKQREALKGLRAGKSPANQRAIVKPGTAKHMGGAKKIVGKPSGMGDAAQSRIPEMQALIKTKKQMLRRVDKGDAKSREVILTGIARLEGRIKRIQDRVISPMKKMHDTMGGIHEKRLQKALVAAKGDAVLSRKIRKMIKENRDEPAMHSKKDLSDVGAK